MKYDKLMDQIVEVERKAHDYGGYRRNTDSQRRAKNWRRDDFEGKAILDLACSHGNMTVEAKLRGAKRTFGVEISEVAAQNARDAGLHVKTGSLNDLSLLKDIGGFDTVLFLAVWKTSPFSSRTGLLSHACRIGDVLYFETHRGESPVQVAFEIAHHSDFILLEVLDEWPNEERFLLRASYDMLVSAPRLNGLKSGFKACQLF